MSDRKHVAVIDIGKTNAKVVVVDGHSLAEIGILTRPNTVLPGPPYPHYDIDGLWRFICISLTALEAQVGIDAISITTHGASVVMLDRAGELATPVLDYEHEGPDAVAAQYNRIRPDFSETGSPRLPIGLNIGAQLFWLLDASPDLRARLATVLTYPQYWAFRLSGVLSNEMTSLGCHTDLWCPERRAFSSLVERLGLSRKMAPVRKATDCLGTLLPSIAGETGLSPDVPVYCGIHDSNASLYPHLRARKEPFSVVSTGTWVIAMSIGGKQVALDPARDSLINVNAHGDPVPSARFMGGREFDSVMGSENRDFSVEDVASVIAGSIALLPAVESRSGPFPGMQWRWSVDEADIGSGQRIVALSFYLALMTGECLSMIGAEGPVLVEGPFADNELFLQMLGSATGRPVIAAGASATGTSTGAALLTDFACHPEEAAGQKTQSDHRDDFARYADAWREALQDHVRSEFG